MEQRRPVTVLRGFTPTTADERRQRDLAERACVAHSLAEQDIGGCTYLHSNGLALREPDGTLWFRSGSVDQWCSAQSWVRSQDGVHLTHFPDDDERWETASWRFYVSPYGRGSVWLSTPDGVRVEKLGAGGLPEVLARHPGATVLARLDSDGRALDEAYVPLPLEQQPPDSPMHADAARWLAWERERLEAPGRRRRRRLVTALVLAALTAVVVLLVR